MKTINKNDLRVIKTKENIYHHFYQLLCKKNLNKITVKEITDTCRISRSTFYLHFFDKYHLLEEMLSYFDKKLFEEIEVSPSNIHHIYKILLENIKHNLQFYKHILNSNGSAEVEKSIHQLYVEDIKMNMDKYDDSKQLQVFPKEIMAYFVAGAILNTIKWWINDQCKMPVEELIMFFKTIFYS